MGKSISDFTLIVQGYFRLYIIDNQERKKYIHPINAGLSWKSEKLDN